MFDPNKKYEATSEFTGKLHPVIDWVVVDENKHAGIIVVVLDDDADYPGIVIRVNKDLIAVGGWTIREVSPYKDWQIDDRLEVSYKRGPVKHRRYFARVSSDGRPTYFRDGANSWSAGAEPFTVSSDYEVINLDAEEREKQLK